MKNLIRTVFAVFLLASPVGAGELSFSDVIQGSLQLRGLVGYGNVLTHDLWEQGRLQPNERLLESFSFFVSGTGPMTYLAGVGILSPDGATLEPGIGFSFGDYTRLETGSYEIKAVMCGGSCEPGEPNGLILDPTRTYVAYMMPASIGGLSLPYPWTIAKTPPGYYDGIVGVTISLDSTNRPVTTLNQPFAMNVTISEVPEPSILMLMSIGLFTFGARLRRR
jgi:hypothetical protein